MIHLGDITKIKGSEAPTVNVVIGGSPCQDLSVAGKRAGMKHSVMGDEETTRSGLFMEQLRIIKEMRESDANSGRTGANIRPRYMVWENVPGAFSSNKGADFGAVLQETAKVVCKEAPAVPMPKSGWPNAGCLTGMGTGGDSWSIAWRVFDAQFWGVPQRRRRIALVADFGGLSAPEILFEREGLSRYLNQSGAAWKGFTRTAENSTAQHDPVLAVPPQTLKIRSGCEGGGKGPLIQIDKSATLSTLQDQTLFQPVMCVDKASTLRAGAGAPKHLSDMVGRLVAEPIMCVLNDQGGGVINVEDGNVSPTLRAESHNHEPNVVYCIQGNAIGRSDNAGCNGAGFAEDVSYTLNTIDRPAVAYAVDCRNAAIDEETSGALQSAAFKSLNANNIVAIGNVTYQDVAGTLNPGAHAGSYNGQDAYNDLLIANPVVYDARGNGDGEVCPTITGDHENRVTDYTAVCVQNTGFGWWNQSEVGATLRTPCGGDAMKANLVCESVVAFTQNQRDEVRDLNGKSGSLQAEPGMKQQTFVAEQVGVDIYNGSVTGDKTCSLTTATGQGAANTGPSVLQRIIRWIVRRLTPLECERLQGFPDGWTDIGEWVDTKGKVHKEADSPRYKALGNSIALPSWAYVLQKLSLYCGADNTMASLFDGIGGFPLIWETLNGKGTCVWASEIEEFPIAVTKKHFGG